MKYAMKTRQSIGKPKRRDFSFERFMNPMKSGTNAEFDLYGNITRWGTHQMEKLPIKEFIPHRGMNRRQRRMRKSA